MKKAQGFTLIELVIVIVILGILAITAAPKFLNLAGDARASTVNGVKAALQSANAVIYSKAVLQNKQSLSSASVTDTQGNIDTVFGYAAATTAAVTAALDVASADYTIAAGVANSNLVVGGTAMATTDVMIYPTATTAPTGSTTTAEACVLIYRAAASATAKPAIATYTTGC